MVSPGRTCVGAPASSWTSAALTPVAARVVRGEKVQLRLFQDSNSTLELSILTSSSHVGMGSGGLLGPSALPGARAAPRGAKKRLPPLPSLDVALFGAPVTLKAAQGRSTFISFKSWSPFMSIGWYSRCPRNCRLGTNRRHHRRRPWPRSALPPSPPPRAPFSHVNPMASSAFLSAARPFCVPACLFALLH